jgi:Protein of unknown function (DUF2812)
MSGSTVTTFKFFWAHQDEQQEAWLRSQAQKGLHLVNVNPFCFWTFRRGEPADIVYRVNYANTWDKSDSDFRQFMEDAGWTLAATTVGWQYWATPAVNGKAPEIFTDAPSKAKKFEQLLIVIALCALPSASWFWLVDWQAMLAGMSTRELVELGVIALIYLAVVPYAIVSLLMRLRQIRKPRPA